MKSQMLLTLHMLIEQLGDSKLAHDFTEEVTHVVTLADSMGYTPRTLKYCCAVLTGAWIVSFDWILASLAAKAWVAESLYEIKGDQHAEGAPNKARSARNNGESRLFSGKSFCFVGDFSHPAPSLVDLETVISIGNGTVLPSLPPLPHSVKQYLETNDYVICDPINFTEAEAVKVQMSCSLIPLSYQWILDSISNYAILPPENYKCLPENMHRFETQQSLSF